MSAYKNIETKFYDRQCLLEALKEIGYGNVESHESPVNLVGYHGDIRSDKAEIIIRRKHVGSASNDIGFKKSEEGTYKAIISNYDSGKHNQKWLDKLSQIYAKKKVMKTAVSQKLTLKVPPQTQNGKTIIRFKVSN